MTLLLEGVLVWTGLGLIGIAVAAASTRQRLDRLALAFVVAGTGAACVAAGLGDLSGSAVGQRLARAALVIALAQGVVLLGLAAAVASRLRATRTEQLNRLRG
jgi:hypothetical protein